MIECFGGGLLGSNAYVVYDGAEAMLIDCGVFCDDICAFLSERSLNLKYIVLTHGHFDHAEYAQTFATRFTDATVICHADEVKVLRDSVANVTSFLSVPHAYELKVSTVCDGDTLCVGALTLDVIHTPGHTPGGICLLCKSENAIFVGDTLFCNGYGRTDFKYGNINDLRASLKRLFSLDDRIEVYSGHGPRTTIGREKFNLR